MLNNSYWRCPKIPLMSTFVPRWHDDNYQWCSRMMFYSVMSAGVGYFSYLAFSRLRNTIGKSETMGQQHSSYSKASTSENYADDTNERNIKDSGCGRSTYSKIPSSDSEAVICGDDSFHEFDSSRHQTQESGPVVDDDAKKRSSRSFKRVIIRTRTDDHCLDGDGPSTRGIVISVPQQNACANGFSSAQYQKKLQDNLNALYGSNKLINEHEARSLTALLQQRDEESLLKVVTTMCNLAAFTINQDLFRNNGAIDALINLLVDEKLGSSVRLMLTQCIGNMAVNVQNHALLQVTVPYIVQSFVHEDCSELQKIISVQTLINLSAQIASQNESSYVPVIQPTLDRLWSSDGPNLNSLRLLINLSFVPSLAINILKSQTTSNFVELLSPSLSTEILIRSATFFCHLYSHNVDHLTEDEDLSPKTVYALLFLDKRSKTKLKNYVDTLESNRNEELCEKARRIKTYL